jgi:ATP synthase protein I
MSGEGQPPSLKGLGARLRQAREASRPKEDQVAPGATPGVALGQAIRLAVEMVSALAVGGGLGWFLDGWLETRPWLLLLFLLLGAAAGILNAYRAAMRLTPGFGPPADDEGETNENTASTGTKE